MKIEPGKVYVLRHEVVNPSPDKRQTRNCMAAPRWKTSWRFATQYESGTSLDVFSDSEGSCIGDTCNTDNYWELLIANLTELPKLDSAAVIAKHRMESWRATAFYKWLGDKLGPRVLDALLTEWGEDDDANSDPCPR